MTVADEIHAKLTGALAPSRLEVVDESHKHEGHGGWREGGETHFHVTVVSAAFDGKSRVDRQRLVYEILADELAGPVHALALTTRAPAED
jgi:BolA protein